MFIDITFPISEVLPVWPDSIGYKKKWHLKMSNGATNNLSSFEIDSHLGTHLDAPLHFVENGKAIDELDFNKLIGEVYVAEIPGRAIITAADLQNATIPGGCRRLLLKTDNAIYWKQGLREFQKDFCALDVCAAQWIVDNGIELVGIDYLSIQRFDDGPEVHQILLQAEVVIVESLNLADVAPGNYHLICLPVKLKGLEGAPVRAILKTIDNE